MKEAMFQERLEGGKVRCGLCAHRCVIDNAKGGICAVRENRGGTLYTLVYDKVIARHVDPIEKKPLFHFLPGSRSYSIAAPGCNFRCKHCQNADISQLPRDHRGLLLGDAAAPREIVHAALAQGCESISYTYTEPTIYFELAADTAEIAKAAGLQNVFVSNGYMTPEALAKARPWLAAANIDLKAFTDEFYRTICGARLLPVLDSISLAHRLGMWIEITTLVIPGHNDSEQELHDIAQFIKSLSADIPWHVSRFHPTYKLTDAPPTPVSTLARAREIGLEAGLRYVYVGNVPGEGETTSCGNCGTDLILRIGYRISENKIHNGRCPSCGAAVPGVWSGKGA